MANVPVVYKSAHRIKCCFNFATQFPIVAEQESFLSYLLQQRDKTTRRLIVTIRVSSHARAD
jgi:hypothetical protein